MNGKLPSGMISGMIIGAALGTAIISKLDNKQRKKVFRTSKSILSSASTMMGDMRMFRK